MTAYNHFDPSSQLNYPQDRYEIAEKIQNAIRQPPSYAPTQVNTRPLSNYASNGPADDLSLRDGILIQI